MFVNCFISQWMKRLIKTWPLRFPAKENPNIDKALFDWPNELQYDVKAKYRLISRKFLGMKCFSPEPKATRVCIRSINQSNHSISVRLLFPFFSRVFISRSYENRSNNNLCLDVKPVLITGINQGCQGRPGAWDFPRN